MKIFIIKSNVPSCLGCTIPFRHDCCCVCTRNIESSSSVPSCVEPLRLLPLKPSLSRCPTCKAFIGINPVGVWSFCRNCGMSFHDLDRRHAFALVSGTRRAETTALSLARGVACQNGQTVSSSGNALSILQPIGKYKKVKKKLYEHPSLFGDAILNI